MLVFVVVYRVVIFVVVIIIVIVVFIVLTSLTANYKVSLAVTLWSFPSM